MKIILLLLFLFIPFSCQAISAESYVVMDYDTGRVLMSKSEEKKKLIASTTKIMTCIIALENGDLNSIRKVGNEVLKAYGSGIYVQVGEEMSLENLLYGLMLRSGNDAAIEIAYHISGNLEKFVVLMNQKAYELGMKDTTFLNPHGLEEDDGSGNVSTAKDMAILMRYALQNEMFLKIIGTKIHTVKGEGKTYVWHNKNKLLSMSEYALGGKTGYTKKANRTLVTASRKDDKTCIVVTLNDGNDFLDHKNLCDEVFEDYQRVTLVDKETFIFSENLNPNYYLERSLYGLLKQDEVQKVRVEYQITNENSSEVGVVQVFLKDELLASEKILNKLEEKKEGFFTKFLRWLFSW
ncbi:MAG: D-alanyl-D-alanine carboxypeptidase [Bacilli bacterium]|nr:D-alanyl-D-alanine carboxypeptidase [Bacilli bacterium]